MNLQNSYFTIALIKQCGTDNYQKFRQSYYSGHGIKELVLKKYNIRLSNDILRALREKWDAFRHHPSDSLSTFTLKGLDCVQGIGVETTEDLSIVFTYLMSDITQSVELMADFAGSCRAEHPNVIYIIGNQKLYLELQEKLQLKKEGRIQVIVPECAEDAVRLGMVRMLRTGDSSEK